DRQHDPEEGAEDRPAIHVVHVAAPELKGGVGVREESPVDLSGRDSLGEQGGDGSSRAHADVDVEPGAREIKAEEVVQGGKAADLVERAREPAPGEAEADLLSGRGRAPTRAKRRPAGP